MSTRGCGVGKKKKKIKLQFIKCFTTSDIWIYIIWTFISKVHVFVQMRLYKKSINLDNRINVSENTFSSLNLYVNGIILLGLFISEVFLWLKTNNPTALENIWILDQITTKAVSVEVDLRPDKDWLLPEQPGHTHDHLLAWAINCKELTVSKATALLG